jgi:CO/xanthine dehydrogenase FAD-binding subunit
MAGPEYVRAHRLQEALECLAAGGFEILCGGTDWYPANAQRACSTALVDISGLSELRQIEQDESGVEIGAAVTWSEIREAEWPASMAALPAAAREIGGIQIQNTGSIGGNVCNASPAADGIVALLALDARLVLASRRGTRELALAEFVAGARRTLLRRDELLRAVRIPARGRRARSVFAKLGARRHLVISIAMVAVQLDSDEAGRILTAAIAVGSCSAHALRLGVLEARLLGHGVSEDLAALVRPTDLAGLAPIDDVRAGRAYRQSAAEILVRRALTEAKA